MTLFTGIQHLYNFNIVAPLFITIAKSLEGVVHHQRVHLSWFSVLTALHGKVHLVCCTESLVVFFSFWRRDCNRMDSGENDDTWWYRTPSFFITMQTVTPLQWEILKHAPYSPDMSPCEIYLRQSERTTAKGPIQHNRWTYQCYREVNTDKQRWTPWWCMTPSKIWQNVINKG